LRDGEHRLGAFALELGEESIMALSGVHLLLTYRCDRECDHCFVWGSPTAEGTMTLAMLREIFDAAERMGTVKMVYFEGGEPFLFFPVMVEGMRLAAEKGFDTGIVSNAYWATCPEDAALWLGQLAGLRLVDLSVSSDLFHADEQESAESRHVREAADRLGLPVGLMSISAPCVDLPPAEGGLRYRGRAADQLAPGMPLQAWEDLRECPHEDLVDPGRVHIDPFGYVHLCQGVVLGNVRERPLDELWAAYDPQAHPIVGALLEGGPAGFVRRYDLPHEEGYVEECHLCYRAREALLERFPQYLGPDQVYGRMT
jgi:MoaA/NifB/PqqE/SkfB family radical SAM enzyme